MAKESEQVPEGQSQTTEAGSENLDQKSYSAEAFKDVVKQRDEVKSKLRKLEEEKEKLTKSAEEATLKAKGDYDTLISKVTAERDAEKKALNNLISQTYLNALGAEYGIAKPEYLKLVDVSVELDGLQITNDSEVKKAFEVFKKENPNLFTNTEKKPVPKTDGTFKKPENNQKLDNHIALIDAVEQSMKNWSIKH